jgi:dTDP-4-dehydrorhamnose 3,5-epimerase
MSNFSSERLPISEIIRIRPRKFTDSRGYFLETFRRSDFASMGINCDFVQDNESLSLKAGTIRGMHFQLPPHTQAKLVRVLRGTIFDVGIDLRCDSQTYGKWCGMRLSAEGGEQLFIPRGFAHAFCTLEPDTIVAYKVDAYYAPQSDTGLIWNDPQIAVDWPIPPEAVLVSDKDGKLPSLQSFASPFRIAEP